MTADKTPELPHTPGAPTKSTVGEKSAEAQNHGSSTSEGSTHNYQAANATEPNQFAEMAGDKRERFAKNSADTDKSGAASKDEEGEFRQHDAGG